ncbi:MAG: ATP-grasp domain-containing protein [Methanosphaera stadtmanae]|nr:ATP-grasp domain-containing protein [Methanosphaera stadtmanae]
MKLLVFEYSTCTNMSNLLSEGTNMLKSILYDLDLVDEYDVDYLINHSIMMDELNNCNPIILDENLISWLDNNVKSYDYVLFIAPEDDYIQYEITRTIEKYDVNIIGCNSIASGICCSKSKSYEYVNENITKIPSLFFNVDDVDMDFIRSELSDNLLIKPDDKTSSDYIYHIHDMEQLMEILEEYQKNNITKCIIQEYIKGRSVSVSLICNKKNIQILSVNSQIIKEESDKITYFGCESPINDEKEEQLHFLSKEIIKSIPGLCGFIGIDYIISEEKIYFVEINSRITTPYIILSRNCNKNLTKYLIESVINYKEDIMSFKKNDMFFKEE